METKTFDDFGELEFLEPETYYKEGWTYAFTAKALEDDLDYDIVRMDFEGYRYTII